MNVDDHQPSVDMVRNWKGSIPYNIFIHILHMACTFAAEKCQYNKKCWKINTYAFILPEQFF